MMLDSIGFHTLGARDAVSSLEAIPETEGVYAFLLRPEASLPTSVPTPQLALNCNGGEFGLLYIGATGDSLRYRLKQHLKAPSPASTMRMSLGLLLQAELGLRVIPHTHKRYFWFADEAPLSEWLYANTVVAVRACENAFGVEATIHAEGSGLLNISGARSSEMAKRLQRLRRQAVPPRPSRR